MESDGYAYSCLFMQTVSHKQGLDLGTGRPCWKSSGKLAFFSQCWRKRKKSKEKGRKGGEKGEFGRIWRFFS